MSIYLKNEVVNDVTSNFGYIYSTDTKLKFKDENGVITSFPPTNSSNVFLTKSSDYTIQISDCGYGNTIYNDSYTDVTFTLPAPSAGLTITIASNNNAEYSAYSNTYITTSNNTSILLNGKITTKYKIPRYKCITLVAVNTLYWIILDTQQYIVYPKFTQIANKGVSFVLGLKQDGKVFGWGLNASGNLGDNTVTNRSTPVAVCTNLTFCQIASGDSHSLGLDNTGKLWAWGLNTNGQLGDGTTVSKRTPVAVCTNLTFCQISAKGGHNLAIDNTGKLWSWGLGTYGRLGLSTTTNRSTPTAVCCNITFKTIYCGTGGSMGIDIDNRAWAWGLNDTGILGLNDKVSRLVPTAICGNITFSQLGIDGNFAMGIDINGKAWSWGTNNMGALGDGTTVSKLTPIAVCGNITFKDISVDVGFSIGIDIDDKVWSWGLNSSGQLGANIPTATTSHLTPVTVCTNITFCKIFSGNDSAYAIDINGYVWGWGNNTTTQLSILDPGNFCANVITPTLINQ